MNDINEKNKDSINRRISIIILIVSVLMIVVLAVVLFSFLSKSKQRDSFVTASPLATSLTKTLFVSVTSSKIPVTTTKAATKFIVVETVIPDSIYLGPSGTEGAIRRISIVKESTEKGDYLTVSGGIENYNYKVGPLSNGIHAIGPNDKFMVYVTNNGDVFAARFGDTTLFKVTNIRKKFSALYKGVEPDYSLSFYYNGYVYYLVIFEERYGEEERLILPRAITY